jgi:glycosyltransferase involved in cell wall biosynthesis
MNSQPKISVLIPVYNGEKYIRETISSVLGQTFFDFELLLMDDDSTDKSVTIINSFDDPRIRYERCPHNFVDTFNRGLDKARGKYIALIDHDDIMVPHRLQTQYDFMESHPDIVACGSYMNTFGKEATMMPCPVNYRDIILELVKRRVGPIYNPTGFIRKDTVEKYHLRYKYGYSFAVDTKFWTDVVKVGKINNIPEVLVWYRLHETQTSNVFTNESHKTMEVIAHEFFSFLISKLNEKEKTKSIIEQQLIPSIRQMIQLSLLPGVVYYALLGQIVEGLYRNGFLNLDEPLDI